MAALTPSSGAPGDALHVSFSVGSDHWLHRPTTALPATSAVCSPATRGRFSAAGDTCQRRQAFSLQLIQRREARFKNGLKVLLRISPPPLRTWRSSPENNLDLLSICLYLTRP